MSIYNSKGLLISAPYNIRNSLDICYDVNNDRVFEKGGSNIDYTNYVIEDYATVNISNIQGFDIYDGIIFQFRAHGSTEDIMTTIDAANNQVITDNISCASGHGDSASFSYEFYSQTDNFPLLYVTADTEPAKIYINRVTDSTSQLIKTYSFPLEKTGYYPALCLDSENGIMYLVGYSEPNYQTDDGGNNKSVVSVWDTSVLIENGDDTYTPTFVASYNRAFIYCMQGQQFHDGMLWIASGGTNVRGYIHVLDPEDGKLLYLIDTETTTELEGLAFISDTEMVFGLQGGTYKKVTFQQLT